MPQIIFFVALADCYLVSEYDTDCPHSYNCATTMFLVDARPHHLIILFPSSTLRVAPFPNVCLSRRALQNPRTVQPLFDALSHFQAW